MSQTSESYYDTLGVPHHADEAAIKKAYRKEALQWHPDKHQGDDKIEAEIKFKLIAEAYEVLRDPEKRKVYDVYGKEGLQSGQGSSTSNSSTFQGFRSPDDIFREFFGGRSPFDIFHSDPFGSSFMQAPFGSFSSMHRGHPYQHPHYNQHHHHHHHHQNVHSHSHFHDPFADMGFGNFGFGGLGGFGSFGGFPDMSSMSSSSSSFSFSNSSRSGGSGGFIGQQTTTQIVNGKRTTIQKTTDAQGNVTETTTVQNPDGTSSQTTKVNGVLQLEGSRRTDHSHSITDGGSESRMRSNGTSYSSSNQYNSADEQVHNISYNRSSRSRRQQ